MKKHLIFALSLLFVATLFGSSDAQHNRITLQHGQEIFVSGINVAWHRFGDDVGSQPVDEAWFTQLLDSLQGVGGNSIRWWLFTNAANAPEFGDDGLVSGPGEATITNIKKVLDLAHQRGIVISLCLFSFDLFQDQQGVDHTNNETMMTTDEGIQAMIDNALIPLVKAIGPHPAIMCWEMFNEPEGMAGDVEWAGWTEDAGGTVSITDIQKVINRSAGAIHREMPGVPVSNGSWCFKVASNVITRPDEPGFNVNYYSDSALVEVGGDPDGTLDFYQVHYYDWAKEEFSPFHHPASYWGLDKPIVIGEFSALGFSENVQVSPLESYQLLYDNGYAGAMSWTYTNHDGHGGLDDAAEGIGYLYDNYPEDVIIVFPPVARDDFYAVVNDAALEIETPGVLANDESFSDEPLDAQLIEGSVQGGSVTLQADGSFAFEAASGFSGKAFFSYAAKDGKGGMDTALVTLQVYDPETEHFFSEPDAAKWIYRDPWQYDQTRGAGVSNDNGLVIHAAQWGPEESWAINSGDSIQLEQGTEYFVRFRFRDDPASSLGSLNFLMVKAWDDRGVTDSLFEGIPAENLTSLDFSEHTIQFVAPESGYYHMAFHLVWDDPDDNGPNSEYYATLRDILVSTSPVTPVQCPKNRNIDKGFLKGHIRNGILTISQPTPSLLKVSVYSVDGRLLESFTSEAGRSSRIDFRKCIGSTGSYVVKVKSVSGGEMVMRGAVVR
ncbi:MAG: Ig-like domain-containing protein [Chitinispirillaceae bacterium]